jgi:hypothetical protein
MKTTKVVPVRLTLKEYQYALALSKRTPGCKRKYVGSIAHGLRWSLREQARIEGLKIFE